MRISDWSSDVCSSDLDAAVGPEHRPENQGEADRRERERPQGPVASVAEGHAENRETGKGADRSGPCAFVDREDRKSVVQGTSVSVRVELGGGRIIKKKNKNMIRQ